MYLCFTLPYIMCHCSLYISSRTKMTPVGKLSSIFRCSKLPSFLFLSSLIVSYCAIVVLSPFVFLFSISFSFFLSFFLSPMLSYFIGFILLSFLPPSFLLFSCFLLSFFLKNSRMEYDAIFIGTFTDVSEKCAFSLQVSTRQQVPPKRC